MTYRINMREYVLTRVRFIDFLLGNENCRRRHSQQKTADVTVHSSAHHVSQYFGIHEFLGCIIYFISVLLKWQPFTNKSKGTEHLRAYVKSISSAKTLKALHRPKRRAHRFLCRDSSTDTLLFLNGCSTTNMCHHDTG